ncbi:glycosyltransferase [Dyadobacter subterraneus]|uniref:Glycosyltransferase n=1 Tax=Dyadobacter subterraneus TaxID=2773304 RepID=A0ABR9WP40_9BACT|nr:glycosyltransferase [Dyadobacter subterraneus]MBE9466621.1 glycosyltransferase [Dyadobacter subterraneus]
MKILLVNDSLRAGGAQRQFVELVKGLTQQKDVKVEVLLFSDEIEYPEIYSTQVTINMYPRKKSFDLTSFKGVSETIRRFQPDVIHSWHFVTNLYLFPLLLGKKILFIDGSIRDAHPPAQLSARTLINFLSKKISTATISNSAAGLRAYKIGSKGYVIYNGIDLNRFTKNKTSVSLESIVGSENMQIESPKVIGMVARFDTSKDYATFLSVANTISVQRPNILFVAIGEGKDLEHFKQLYKDNHQLIFPGRIVNVEAFVEHFDIGVLLSNPAVHAEGISNSILEYMASGKAVIATRDGGTTELVDDGVTGYLIDPKSEESLARSINNLIDDKDMNMKLGGAGLNKIRSEFSFEKMINEYIKLYQTLMKNGKFVVRPKNMS